MNLPPDYDADDMRQAEIVLRTKRQKATLIGVVVVGLVGFVAAILILAS